MHCHRDCSECGLLAERIGAVVCRGGRPDLAFEALGLVRCPTLLIVGAADVDVLELNAWATQVPTDFIDLLE